MSNSLYLSKNEVRKAFEKTSLKQIVSLQNVFGGNYTKLYDEIAADHSLATKANIVKLVRLDMCYNATNIIEYIIPIFDNGKKYSIKRMWDLSCTEVYKYVLSQGAVIGASNRTYHLIKELLDDNTLNEVKLKIILHDMDLGKEILAAYFNADIKSINITDLNVFVEKQTKH